MRRASLLAWTIWALAGCDCAGTSGVGTAEPGGGEPTGPGAEIPMGTVDGVVRLAEGASVPRYATNPFEGDGPRALPPECSPVTPADAEPMRLVAARAMTNVAVIATGDASRWPLPAAPEVHEIRFHDCRPTPPVVVITRGDRLRLVNEGDYPFFPHLGPGGFYEALLRGEPREIAIDLAGPQSMECAMTAVCGRTEILAFHHPVHTSTGEDGRFRLEVPADQDLTITAWHPLLTDDATVTTRVAAGASVTVEVIVRPRAAAPAPPTAPAADPPDEAPF